MQWAARPPTARPVAHPGPPFMRRVGALAPPVAACYRARVLRARPPDALPDALFGPSRRVVVRPSRAAPRRGAPLGCPAPNLMAQMHPPGKNSFNLRVRVRKIGSFASFVIICPILSFSLLTDARKLMDLTSIAEITVDRGLILGKN